MLREDAKVVFHPYTRREDAYFNLISTKDFRLDSFDIIIVAQALDLGLLVTEDQEILDLREQTVFREDPILGRLTIRKWEELG